MQNDEHHNSQPRKKREYRRRHRADAHPRDPIDGEYLYSSEDEDNSVLAEQVSDQEEEDPDGQFAFKRKKGCMYHAPLTEKSGDWPWVAPEEGGLGDRRFRYCLTSVSKPRPKCIGFARRRYGRGGR